MILSYDHGFVSFACGRTGTTSLEHALSHYDQGTKLREEIAEHVNARLGRNFNTKHLRPDLVRQFLPEDTWENLFKFVFVRNPWDWVLSQYFRHGFCRPFSFRRPLSRRVSFRRPMLGAAEVEAVWDRLRPFNQSLDTDSYLQSRFVYDSNGVKLVDRVGRYESLQNDIDDILRALGLPQHKMPRLNGTRHRHYTEHYTPEGRDMVARLYSSDIEMLGYQFGN